MTTKEEYDLQKQARLKEAASLTRKQAIKKLAPLWGGAIAVVILIIVGFVLGWFSGNDKSGEKPKVNDQKVVLNVQEFSDQGRDHIAVGASHPSYNSNPPTSGWHYTQWADIKIHDQEVPDENLIHNLEHGEIWVAYKTGIDAVVIDQLKEVAKRNSKWVVMAPRAANDADVAVVAWGRLDKFSITEFSQARVQEFINRYRDKGPERVSH